MANEFSQSEVKFVRSGKRDLLKLAKIMGHSFNLEKELLHVLKLVLVL